jgi:hypothetical protein
MRHETHTQHVLKDTDSFYVKICNCGVVHLCFGPTTLNLTGQAVIAVTETLKQVSEELYSRNVISPAPSHTDAPAGNVIPLNFTN